MKLVYHDNHIHNTDTLTIEWNLSLAKPKYGNPTYVIIGVHNIKQIMYSLALIYSLNLIVFKLKLCPNGLVNLYSLGLTICLAFMNFLNLLFPGEPGMK